MVKKLENATSDSASSLTHEEAIEEASRCLFCHDAPCQRSCPADVDVAGFIKAIGTGNRRGAARRLLLANPLAASCARVCPTLELCERRCVLARQGQEPIAIGRLQRYAMEGAMEEGLPSVGEGVRRGGKVAVVGAGPAGLACAFELARQGFSVTVFDARPRPGGLATYAIADHKLPAELAIAEAQWLSGIGFEIRSGVRVGKDVTYASLEQSYDLIFLGLGLESSVMMGVPGEDLPGVVDALALLSAHRGGTDLPVPVLGRRVLVIGGGNTATDVAQLAVREGALSTTLIYRRSEEEMPAYAEERARAHAHGVGFRLLLSPVRVLGEDFVTGLEVQPMTLGESDRSGRRRPVPLRVPSEIMTGDVVIRAIGQLLRDDISDAVAGVKTVHGLIRVDQTTGQTDNPRYFAGGDCVNGGREVVHAAGEGRRAAQAMAKILLSREVSHG